MVVSFAGVKCIFLVSAAAFKMVGLLQEQGSHERDDECDTEQIEGVAERQ